MHILKKKLSTLLNREDVESHEETTDTYKWLEITINNLMFRILPLDDLGQRYSVYVWKDGSEQSRLADGGLDMVDEFVNVHVKHSDKPSYVNKALGKAKEPINRTSADVETPTDDEVDKYVAQLIKDIEKTEKEDAEDDSSTEWDAKGEYKNIVKTFPKDEPKVESEKTPEKEYVASDEEFVKQTPNHLRASKTLRGQPVRLDEGVLGEKFPEPKVLVYTPTGGAEFVPKSLYEAYKHETENVLAFDESEGVILVKKTDAEKYKPTGNMWKPMDIRARNIGK